MSIYLIPPPLYKYREPNYRTAKEYQERIIDSALELKGVNRSNVHELYPTQGKTIPELKKMLIDIQNPLNHNIWGAKKYKTDVEQYLSNVKKYNEDIQKKTDFFRPKKQQIPKQQISKQPKQQQSIPQQPIQSIPKPIQQQLAQQPIPPKLYKYEIPTFTNAKDYRLAIISAALKLKGVTPFNVHELYPTKGKSMGELKQMLKDVTDMNNINIWIMKKYKTDYDKYLADIKKYNEDLQKKIGRPQKNKKQDITPKQLTTILNKIENDKPLTKTEQAKIYNLEQSVQQSTESNDNIINQLVVDIDRLNKNIHSIDLRLKKIEKNL